MALPAASARPDRGHRGDRGHLRHYRHPHPAHPDPLGPVEEPAGAWPGHLNRDQGSRPAGAAGRSRLRPRIDARSRQRRSVAAIWHRAANGQRHALGLGAALTDRSSAKVNDVPATAAHADRHARCAAQPPDVIQGVSRLGQDVVLFHWTALACFPGPRGTEGRSDGDGDRPRVRDGDRHGRGRGERGVRGQDLLLLLRGLSERAGQAGSVVQHLPPTAPITAISRDCRHVHRQQRGPDFRPALAATQVLIKSWPTTPLEACASVIGSARGAGATGPAGGDPPWDAGGH
jgi:hypothetical protein